VLGRRLRALRQDRDEKLSETAGRAGVSPQYLSEIERGRKEPSSEMIAALAGALDTTLITLTEQVAGDLRRQQALAQQALGRQALAPQALAQRTRARASGPVILALAA
jgi:transcriptional regulator with XRE-family HTH domain